MMKKRKKNQMISPKKRMKSKLKMSLKAKKSSLPQMQRDSS